jgi:hypothetical protein
LTKLPIAEGASFGSFDNQHEEECLSGTRIELLQYISEWVDDLQGKGIFWLKGMAGTGKSTISRTVARSLQNKSLLGASFFFKRGEGDRGDARKFFPTIIRQLVIKIPQLVPGVKRVLEDNPIIATQSLTEQFDKLIFQPLSNIKSADHQPSTMIIVIDALDECKREDDIRVILRLLARAQVLNSTRLRFFLTSRPETPIRLGFQRLADINHQDLILHEIPKPVIQYDIGLYLKHRLSEIRESRSLPTDWPGEIHIQTLIKMSVPLFISAATICRILGDLNWDPIESLSEILTHQHEESWLGGTYLPVLNRLLINQTDTKKQQLVAQFREIVGTIILLYSPLPISPLSELAGISKDLVIIRLGPLHSVLSVPNDDTTPVKLFHLSFRDFLLDSKTREKTPLWIDQKEIHHKLFRQCLKIMVRYLKRNICFVLEEGTQRTEIDDHSINQYLPFELQYSCRYWAYHLTQSNNPVCELNDAFQFLETHFLHWVEAMSILNIISEVVAVIDILHSITQVSLGQ